MSTVLDERIPPGTARREGFAWLAVALGLAALYVPTWIDLARGAWRDEAHAHGPIVLAVVAWLAWRSRAAWLAPSRPAPRAGAALLALGLVLYAAGRTFSVISFEVASHVPVIAGAVLLLRGAHGLRALAFPVLFLVFLVPLPSFVLDAVTTPLKSLVSASVEHVVRALGYAVGRSGVVLEVEGHEMLVADACSGLNSLYSLFALGLLYTQLVGRRSLARTAAVLAAMVPIAIAANIVRVTALVLITVHYGEEAAQGFLHGFAGMVVFVTALLLMIGVDALVRRVAAPAPATPASPVAPASPVTPAKAGARSAAIAAATAMLAVALALPFLKPRPVESGAPDLERLIPSAFGEWRIDPDIAQVPPAPDVQASLERIYRQLVARTYVNDAGERMMLLVAYGGDQSDALKAHRQEGCYRAQGFEIRGLRHGSLSAAGRELPVTRFDAVRGARSEPVTYWFTMGDRVVLSRAERLRVQVAEGLRGRVPDGFLVRVSSISADPARAYAAQESFLAAAMAAVPAAQAWRLVGR